MSSKKSHFDAELFGFLRQLAKNNRRDWFQANKGRYESHVRHPALQFISDFGPLLHQISPQFAADPRPVGGSLFRIHRDTRFSKDKRPYKTQVGIQFRHKQRRDVHSPGFYLHLQPGGSFAGAGIYHPDGSTLKRIRGYLAAKPDLWRHVIGDQRLARRFELGGDSLKRAPKGYDPDHPLIEDLKRKDFVVFSYLDDKAVTAPGFLTEFAGLCRDAAPFVRFLCGAVEVPF